MARITVDDCIDRIPNRFDMTLAAAYRARQLSIGATPKGFQEDTPYRAPPAGAPAPKGARRLSEAEARAERLKVLRKRDPALEAAAEVLDLEVLE